MPKVVVLGGGYAGAACAKDLQAIPGVEVTVVDKRSYSVHKVCQVN